MVIGGATQVLLGGKKADGTRSEVTVGFAALAAYARELIEKAK